MLCDNCQANIGASLNAPNSNHLKDIALHNSSLGFYESISSGCFVCRQAWHSIIATICSIVNSRTTTRCVPDNYGLFRRILRYVEGKTGVCPSIGKTALISYDMFTTPSFTEMYLKTGNLELCSFHLEAINNIKKNSDRIDEFRLRIKGTSTASMHLLWRYWLRSFSESHPLCKPSTTRRPFSPERLIETHSNPNDKNKMKWRLIILDGSKHVEYLTLSHCWGKSQHIKLTTKTCSRLRQGYQSSVLPKTFRQALEIGSILGYRYIWIDSLCIFQDSIEDWRKQSSMMGEIYSNSVCNIAATWASNSNKGCYNRRDPFTVTPTTLISNLEPGRPTRYTVSQEGLYHEHTINSPLNSRGWVVQERCLAPKQLSFGRDQVFWECAQLSACERFPNGLPEYEWKGDGTLGVPPTIKPTLNLTLEDELRQTWCSLVEHFSLCELTEPSDKTIALAGLASVYQEKTSDMYLAGHWRSELYQQLCWMKNNVWDTKERVYFRTAQYHGPSWSWVSLDGPVLMDQIYSRAKKSQSQQHTCFLKLLDARIEPENSTYLHSFTSCDVRTQAVAGRASITSVSDNEVEFYVTIDMDGQTLALGGPENDDVFVSWDEDVPRSMKWAHPEQWYRLQQERSSELLLVLVYGQSGKYNYRKSAENPANFLRGLLLGSEIMPEGGLGFKRMGFVELKGSASQLVFEILATRLELASNVPFATQIDLDDPRLAGLVHVIKLI